jgi:hypothetical protein
MSGLPFEERLVYVRDRITFDFEDRPLEAMHSIDRWGFFRSYRYAIQGAHRAEVVAQPDADDQGAADE